MESFKYDLYISYIPNMSMNRIQCMLENLKTKFKLYSFDGNDTLSFNNEYAKIYEGIYSSSLFVCFMNCDYSNNNKCLREIYLAISLHKNILVILMDGNENYLKELESKLNYSISSDKILYLNDDYHQIQTKIKQNLDELTRMNPERPVTGNRSNYRMSTKDSINFKKFTEKLKNFKYKTLSLPVNASDVCQLPNGKIILSSYTNNKLIILDSQYCIEKIVSFINGDYFAAISTTHDNSNRIYICDRVNKRIVLTDMKFNYIKSTRVALNYPMGIFYHEFHLYVCEEGNNRICRLTYDLEEPAYFNVYFSPWQIKIIGNIACIKHNNNSIRFYDISKKFALVATYTGHWGDIFINNGHFIEHSVANNTFYIYNQFGQLIDEIHTNGFNGLIPNYYYHGCNMANDQILFTTRTSKKLIII